MNHVKMAAIKQPGFFARVWSWLGRLLRRNASLQLADKTMVDQGVAPFSLPAVVSKRILPEDNVRLPPEKLRLKPSMVATTKLPASEEPEDTTKVPTPPEQMRLPLLPLPTVITSPRGKARLLAMLEGPTEVTPFEVVSREAETQQVHFPYLVNPTTGSKIIPPTLHSRANEIVPVCAIGPTWSDEDASKTLVQPRIQDNPELLDLVQEFNNEHGDMDS